MGKENASITSRPFTDGDLPRLLALVTDANGDPARPSNWQVGDVLWQMFRGLTFDPAANIRLWADRDDNPLGFAWRDAPGSVVLDLHPRAYADDGTEVAMLAWVMRHWSEPDGTEGARTLTTYAMETDTRRLALLAREGFAREDGHLVQQMNRDLTAPIADAPLPPGAVIRHITDDRELPERVALHREVWSPSAVTLDSYRRMRAAPGYLPELDPVAVLADGAFAAYCVCWLDPVNRTGEFEPVGTRAAYRRQGIGKAVILEGLRRLKARGARTAIVYSVGGNDASLALYQSAGFHIANREYAFTRRWDEL